MNFKKINPVEELNKRIEEDPNFKDYIDVEEISYQIIKTLSNIRKDLNITQSDIENKVGLTQQMVSRIEKYGNNPTLNNFLKYVYALGLEIKFEKSKN